MSSEQRGGRNGKFIYYNVGGELTLCEWNVRI